MLFNFEFGDVFDELINWFYTLLVGFLTDFFTMMGNMGVELFEISWVRSIILFFSYLGWALYVVGLVVAVFEFAIEYQNGQANIKGLALHAIKGFMAVTLFTVVPIRLYELSVNLQSSLTGGLTKGLSVEEVTHNLMTDITNGGDLDNIVEAGLFAGLPTTGNGMLILFLVIMMGYAVIKVFFDSLKRGGILLIQIAVGSLYLFSVPRGYIDGFVQWCKQIVALCLTSFLQVIILTAGLMMLTETPLLGLGLMLSAGEVPRIAGAFGMDTSTKANMIGAVQTTSMVVNTTKNIVAAIPK